MTFELTRKQQKQVQTEGWDLFEASGSSANAQGNWPLQVQRLDEAEILESDIDAHRLVVEGALAGKTAHLKVLKQLRQQSKPELSLIYSRYRGVSLSEYDHQLTNDVKLDALETKIFGGVLTR